MNINNKQRIVIASVLIMGGLVTFMTMNITSAHSAVAQVADQRPMPPEPFTIAVNGHAEPAVVATIKRGQTSQVDVSISPNISGITGKVGVASVFPICGTMNTLPGKCIPSGITATISASKVTSPTHMVVTFSVSNDMPVGVYSFEVAASTFGLHVPFQAAPVNVGNIDSFAIQVT